MIRSRFSVALGAAVTVLSSAPAVAQAPNPTTQALFWPTDYEGSWTKVDTGVFFGEATDENTPALLVLAGSDLVMIREPMSKPEHLQVASDVLDFVVLPAVDGISNVVISTASGAKVGTPQDTDPPTLTFAPLNLGDTWKSAKLLCAAPNASGGAMIAGTVNNLIVRAERDAGNNWVKLPDLTLAAGGVRQLAIANVDATRAGLEIGYVTSANVLRVLDAQANQLFSYDNQRPFQALSRNAGGGFNGIDSFCVLAEYDHGGGYVDDFLSELAATSASSPALQFSAPIFSGAARASSADFTSIGAESNTDFVMASHTTQELIVLHGMPQGVGYPYTALPPPEFLFVSTASIGLTGPRLVAADDFDGDGDGDLVLLGTNAAGRGIWFFRGAPIIAPVLTWDAQPPSIQWGVGSSGEIEVDIAINFPASWTNPPTGQVDKMRVRVWVQDDVEALVAETVARPTERITGVNGVATLTDWLVPTPNDPMLALVHFEFKPLRVDIATGAVMQQAPATFAVGAPDGDVLREFLCTYEDEYTPAGMCGANGSPIILTVNRRRIIMPTSVQAQPQPQ